MLNFLFRADTHNTGIFVSKVYDIDKRPVYIKKSASTPLAISRIKREIVGANWYSEFGEENLISNIVDLPRYCSINFHFVSGFKPDFSDGYWINKNYIEQALNRYCEIWSKLPTGKSVIHGDYSIDNFIFSDKGLTVLDWEHFSEVDIPIGFDALNLIYEQVYISLVRGELNSEVVHHANLMMRKLYERRCLHKTYFNEPLKTLQKYIAKNPLVWGTQASKLPILKLRLQEVTLLDCSIKLD